jgi:hypothetical protein
VRVDEDLSMPISEIFLLDSPQATASVEVQLQQLLTKNEWQERERIAGWHAERTVADTIPSQAAEAVSRRDVVTKGEEAGVPKEESGTREWKHKTDDITRTTMAPSMPTPPPPPPKEDQQVVSQTEKPKTTHQVTVPKKPAKAASSGTPEGTLQEADGRTAGGDRQTPPPGGAKAPKVQVAQSVAAPPVRWWIGTGSGAVLQTDAPPAALSELAGDAGVKRCLVKALADQRVAGRGAIKLLVRIEAGKVTAIVPGGGLRVPGCDLAAYLGQELAGVPAKGWITLEVTLP